MTDLHKTDLTFNPYFQNQRIRRFLIRAGLINRHGDILRPSSDEVSLAPPLKGRRTKENLTKVIHNYVAEEEQSRRAVIRNQIDLSTKHADVKKNKRTRQPHRSVSRSLTNIHRSSSPTNEKRSPKRAKSAHHLSHDVESHFVRRSGKEKAPVKSRCRVIMAYYGPQTIIDYDKSWFQPAGDEIIVMQQHCGGENLTVFKGYVKSGETFAFDSQRHQDYPFALALYINGLIDCRVSVCCEYKHKKNVPLGGPHGSFAISDVQKVKPCRSCQYKRYRKKTKSTTTLVLDPSRYRKSSIPHLPSKNPSHSPVPRRKSNASLISSTNRPRSPVIRRTPTSEEHHKKPSILSTTPNSSVVPTGLNSNKQNSTASRTSQRSSDDDDDKKPSIASVKHNLPVVPTGKSSDVSRISPTISEDNDKKPSITSAKHHLPVVLNGFTSNTQNPVDSQNNNEDYTSDFDEGNDDDYPPTNSRFGRPRISDPHSITKDQGGYNTQSKSSFKISSSSDTLDSRDDHQQTEMLTGKGNNINHSRKSSSTISRKSGPSEDEDNKHLPPILTGKNNITDDSRRSSSSTSRKSGPSPDDKHKRELNEKNTYNRFPSTTTSKKDIEGDRRLSLSLSEDLFGIKHSSSAKKNEDIQYSSKVRRTSTSSSEDFLGIKRSSEEKNKNKQTLSKDWFETDSKNDFDDNDQLNLYSPPKTKSWRTNIISDEDSAYT